MNRGGARNPQSVIRNPQSGGSWEVNTSEILTCVGAMNRTAADAAAMYDLRFTMYERRAAQIAGRANR